MTKLRWKLLMVVLLYVTSYLVLSRMGVVEARRYGMCIHYLPVEDSDRWRAPLRRDRLLPHQLRGPGHGRTGTRWGADVGPIEVTKVAVYSSQALGQPLDHSVNLPAPMTNSQLLENKGEHGEGVLRRALCIPRR